MPNYLSICVTIALFSCTVSASAEIITLKNGDSIHAVVKDETESQLTVEHESLGTLLIIREHVVSINHEQEHLPEDDVAANSDADKGILGKGLLKDWQRKFGMSIVGSSGTSENYTFRTSLNLKYEDDKDRWNSTSVYLLSSDENETSEQKAYTTLTRDWLLSESKFFYFSSTNFYWDEFKDYDYRITQFGGTGYQFVKNKRWDANGRLGLGVKHTVGDELSDETTLEGLVGFKISRVIKNKHSIEGSNIYYPSLSESDEYRNVSTLNWNIKLDYISGLGLKVGLRNEYDTTQDKKYDFDYYISITWDF